jgi:hypothetical protein
LRVVSVTSKTSGRVLGWWAGGSGSTPYMGGEALQAACGGK